MINLILSVIFIHFIADFFLQNDWMAQGKSQKFFPLFCHVIVYSITLYFGLRILSELKMIDNYFILIYSLVNGWLHFLVDYVTSRINRELWKEKKVHWFFVSVGFDQFLHYFILFKTLQIFI